LVSAENEDFAMARPGKKIRFIADHSPHGRVSEGPHYLKGQVYDLEISYAEKYIRLGKAESADGAQTVITEVRREEVENEVKPHSAVHRGFGKWDVLAPDGETVIVADLNKSEAAAKVVELNEPAEQ
jgi:hypothetical protein